MSGSEGIGRISGQCCFKVFWKFFLLTHPMEMSEERAFARDGSEGKEVAALSPLSAWPWTAAGVDADSKRTELVCRSRG